MSVNRNYDPIFGQELAVLARNRGKLQNERPLPDGELAASYAALLGDYERLLRMTKKISAISDAQGLMLKRREQDIRSLLDHAGQGFLTIGADLKVGKLYSQECTRLFGGKIGGANIAELLWPNAAETDAKRSEGLLLRLLKADGPDAAEAAAGALPSTFSAGGKRIAADYKRIPAEATDDGPLVMVILTDITEQLASQEKISYLSTHDPLTSLYNRMYVEPMLEVPQTEEELPYSLMLVDLNGLKMANDVFGHRTGDRLLVRAASLLNGHAGRGAVAARWGGDEFVVLLPRTDETACAALTAELKAACEKSEADPVKLSMAIGFATLRKPGVGLYSTFASAEKAMYKNKLLESRKVRATLMDGVSEALLSKGYEDPARLEGLLDLTLRFAGTLGLAPDSPDMRLLRSLVKLHDAGNLALPDHILQKSGELDGDEWEIVKSHSEIGYRMAQSIGEWALAEAILGMHERWDGNGYPYGLEGRQIPYVSRLFAVVDAYDAMTHDRVFKPRLDSAEAARVIRDAAGTQFDPEMARAFAEWVKV